MSTTRENNRTSAWNFRREVNLGHLLQLLLLAVMAITAWTNLQQELALIQHELNRLVTTGQTLHQHMERLNSECLEHEYRLKTLEQQKARAEQETANMDWATAMVNHGPVNQKGELPWVMER